MISSTNRKISEEVLIPRQSKSSNQDGVSTDIDLFRFLGSLKVSVEFFNFNFFRCVVHPKSLYSKYFGNA